MVKAYRDTLRQRMMNDAEPHAVRHIGPTFDGDPESAWSLSIALRNTSRGIYAYALWRAKIPVPAFRAFFGSVWEHDHREVIAAAKYRRTLQSMFRYAAFPLPDHLPPVVRVWRGTSALTQAKAARGYSWTTDRDCACWFAYRFAAKNGRPLVLTADVERDQILFYSDERSESEAVIFDIAPKLDPNPADWRKGFER